MKTRFHKLTAWLLTLAMIMTILPGVTLGAIASDYSNIYVGGVEMADGNYLDLEGNILDSEPEDGYAHYSQGVLTLSDYDYEGEGYTDGNITAAIRIDGDVELAVYGTNRVFCVNSDAENSYGIYISGNVTVTGTGYLTVNGGGASAQSYGVYVDGSFTQDGSCFWASADTDSGFAGLYVTGDLTINSGNLGAYILSGIGTGVCFEGNFAISDDLAILFPAEYTIDPDLGMIFEVEDGNPGSAAIVQIDRADAAIPERIYADYKDTSFTTQAYVEMWGRVFRNNFGKQDGRVIDAPLFYFDLHADAIIADFCCASSYFGYQTMIPTDGRNHYDVEKRLWTEFTPPVVAWADDNDDSVVDSDEDTYYDLELALHAGGNIKLAQDINYPDANDFRGCGIYLQGTEENPHVLNFDLNGYTITTDSPYIFDLGDYVSMTITDTSDDHTGSVVTTDNNVFLVESLTSSLTIKAGNYESQYTIAIGNGEKIIEGGKFNHDPSSYVAQGYVAVYNGDGTWSVTADDSGDSDDEEEFTLVENEDGYYEIGTPEEMIMFANYVNGENQEAKGILTDDIDLTGYSIMIGDDADFPYKGSFDGDNHTLTVELINKPGEEYVAPFRYTEGATITNLTVDGTITTDNKFAAGIVGLANEEINLVNCISAVTIESTVNGDGTHGGLVGTIETACETNISYCAFVGTMNGADTHSNGGLVGWTNDASSLNISNSYVSGNFNVNSESGDTFVRTWGGHVYYLDNCYYVNANGNTRNGVKANAEDVLSGKLTYMLNGNSSQNPIWKQTLGEDGDAYPNFTGDIVYYDWDNEVYTNTETEVPVNDILIDEGIEHGTVTSDKDTAQAGTTVTITVTPDEDYVLRKIDVTDSSGEDVDVKTIDNNTFTFVMPGKAVTVTAEFFKGDLITLELTDEYGDGWNGNLINAYLIDGEEETLLKEGITIGTGSTAIYTLKVPEIAVVRFDWIIGSYSGECNVIITRDGIEQYNSGMFTKLTFRSIPNINHVIETNTYEEGSVIADTDKTYPGARVTLSVVADEGKIADTITVTDTEGEPVEVEKLDNITYSFIMPNSPVTVGATFREAESYAITIDENIANGSVTAPETALEGSIVTLVAKPDEFYYADEIIVEQNGVYIDVKENATFVMPSGDVTVSALFEQMQTEKPFINVEVFDSKVVVTATGKGTVKLYDSATMKELSNPYTIERGTKEKRITFFAVAYEEGKLESEEASREVIVQVLDIPINKLWVGGEQFTEDKLVISGGDGTATYDPETNTVILNNYTYVGKGYKESPTDMNNNVGAISYIGEKTLNLVLIGENVLTATESDDLNSCDGVVSRNADLVISGRGSLTATGSRANYSDGIYSERSVIIKSGTINAISGDSDYIIQGVGIFAGNDVIIEGGNVKATSQGGNLSAGIVALYGKLIVSGGRLEAVSADEGTSNWGVFTASGVELDNAEFVEPINAVVKNGIVYDGENIAGSVLIEGEETVVEATVIFDANGGSVESEFAQTVEGKLESLPTPKRSGYRFEGWFDSKKGGKEVTANTIFAEDITIYAHWEKKSSGGSSSRGVSSIKIVASDNNKDNFSQIDNEDIRDSYSKKEFADVHPLSHWATEDIDYVYSKGLMAGTADNAFSPDVNVTRAMLATVLYRMEGKPAVNRSIPFGDVDMGAYYADAVVWAKQNGIVAGYSETSFGPDDSITREQIAAIIYRYAQYKGMNVVTLEDNLHFADSKDISDYAVSAMNWAVGTGLMKGKSTTTINPKDNATRAEIAAILHRFAEVK